MKFLHLSDLHIGKIVNGFPMLEEQRNAFERIIGYVDTEKPGAVLIAGDVYDRAVPGVEAVRLFDDFLTELAAKDIAVLLISGNHDSPERLNYASRLLSLRKLHLCGVFEGKPRYVTLSDKYGEIHFWLLPFIKPSGVRGIYADKEIESYTDAVTAAIESADIDYSQRNVLVSHQFYTMAGVAPIRAESEINPVGGLDAVDAAILSRFDYAALGHLHGAQNISHNIRYAGSPVKFSFSEWKQEKSVTLVTLNEKDNIDITALPLKPIRDLREIKGPLERLISGEIASLNNREDYLRVILTDEEEIIDAMGKLRGVYPNVMSLDFENSRSGIGVSAVPGDIGRVETLSPYDLFGEFFHAMNGTEMSAPQAKIVRELLETERGA